MAVVPDDVHDKCTALLAKVEAERDALREGGDMEIEDEAMLWTCDDAPEGLSHSDPDECIEDYLDNYCDPPKWIDGKWTPLPREEQVKRLPERITVYGYKRAPLVADHILDPDTILERIYEALDEEHNGGEEPTEPTTRVQEAAAALCAVIREEYVPWNCERVATREIVVAEWLAQHPDFFDDTCFNRGRFRPPSHSDA